ncbi:tetratricopeptide repeat protein 27 isoform X2 [Orussus abietinus]|nr:tetratricopeptide repeat protein 27 isoform X2 [Orussus abietinus]
MPLTQQEYLFITTEQVPNVNFDSSRIESVLDIENFAEAIARTISEKPERYFEWLCDGIVLLFNFIQSNWIKPKHDASLDLLTVKRTEALEALSFDDECNENIQKPELLYIAKLIFSNEKLRSAFKSCAWWKFRANLLHQQFLEMTSPTLFQETERLISYINQSIIVQDEYLKTLFHLEAVQFYIHCRRSQACEKHLNIALKSAMLDLELHGVMGKRTKYQKERKALLSLKITLEKDPFPSKCCGDLPDTLDLNDEVRLEKIEFSEPQENPKLGAVEEAVILAKFFQIRLSQPRDNLVIEEIMPYLNNVIDNTKNWALKMSALYQRCFTEMCDRRAAERAMLQAEHLLEYLNCSEIPVADKLYMFFASGMEPRWMFKQILANLMFNLGLIKGAIDIYLQLHLWEDVIICYSILDLKHKAAEIIQQRLERKPTVKLWCLLGDALQETKYYETAWELSEKRSSRAQRHWGFHYFTKKCYEKAIPHLKLSTELNSLQENVWLRLGYAALQVEDWQLAATSYRRYCCLEETSFEAWNNLAKAYIKLGDKPRAWRSLHDAIKCNYDRWEVWENLMIVSVDLGHFSDVIRCYHRILELKGCHIDIQILDILTKVLSKDTVDANGNSTRRLIPNLLQLFGHLTSFNSNNSKVWRMYAEITAAKGSELDHQKATEYLQRAYRCITADPRWIQSLTSTKEVLVLCSDIAQAYLNCARDCPAKQKKAMLGSAKLSLQGVVKKTKEQEIFVEDICTELQKVEEYLLVITDALKEINNGI